MKTRELIIQIEITETNKTCVLDRQDKLHFVCWGDYEYSPKGEGTHIYNTPGRYLVTAYYEETTSVEMPKNTTKVIQYNSSHFSTCRFSFDGLPLLEDIPCHYIDLKETELIEGEIKDKCPKLYNMLKSLTR